jgi:recombination protein RecT
MTHVTQPNTQTPPAKSEAQKLFDYLSSPGAKAMLAGVANKFMKPEDMIRLALLAASRQPTLFECTQTSILRALMDAAAMGISPGGTMGRGWLVPRKNKKVEPHVMEACFDPGWRGLIDIAKRSGLVKSIRAKVVYEGDVFEYEEGSNPHVHHVPNMALGEPESDDDFANPELGRVIAAYAIAVFADGDVLIEVLRKSDIERIRAVSMASAGPWSSWYDEMARKSAVRRLAKYLPYDPLLEKALELATNAEVAPSSRMLPEMVERGQQAAADPDLEEKLRGGTKANGSPPAPAVGEKTRTAQEQVGSPPQDAPKATRAPKPKPTPPTPPATAQATPKPDLPPLDPDVCVVCLGAKGKLDWERDAVPTTLPDGRKGGRHEACVPNPFGMKGEPADSPPPDDVKLSTDDEELQ